mmetsp:Transcript_8153/g.14769  ORF Transcript_8153/g.14769 Transcript_8153/m.14769 type:complete len:329 (-) Transcript_8153:2801-3787(-)
MKARVTSSLVGRALGRVVFNRWKDKALLWTGTLIQQRWRCVIVIIWHRRLRVLGRIVRIGLILGGHDKSACGTVGLVGKHDERLGLSVNDRASSSMLSLWLWGLTKRSIGMVASRRLGGGNVNAGTGRKARKLGNIEMSPVGTCGILPVMLLYVAALVSAGGLRHGGRVHVRILGVHAVVEYHALVETSIGGVVISIVVLLLMSVLAIVLRIAMVMMIFHGMLRRILAMVPFILMMWVRRVILWIHGAAVSLTISRGRAVRRMPLKLAPIHALMRIRRRMRLALMKIRRRMRLVIRPIAPARIINRPLLVLNGRTKMTLVRPRRRSIR